MKNLIKLLSFFLSISATSFGQVYTKDTLRKQNIVTFKPSAVKGRTSKQFKAVTTSAIIESAQSEFTVAEVRAFSGYTPFTSVKIKDKGKEGTFYLDATDVTTADNLGTVLVDASGRRWKRPHNEVDVRWFGAVPNDNIDDLDAIQKTLNYCISENNVITASKGIYNLSGSLIKAQSFNGLNINVPVGTVFKSNNTQPIIKIIGGSGQLCHSKIQNLTIEGNSSQVGIEIDGQCGQIIYNCIFSSLLEGVLFHNNTTGAFSEWNVLNNCNIKDDVLLPIHYKSSNGITSFHGSGLNGENWIVKSNNSQPIVLVDNGCVVYNSPMNLQLWTYTDCTLIENNNTTLPCYFTGKMSFENFNSSKITLANGVTYFSGSIVSFGDFLEADDFLVAEKIVYSALGNIFTSGLSYSKRQILVSGNNIINTPLPKGTFNVIVKIVAPNYDCRYSMLIEHDGYGLNGYVVNLTTIKQFDGVGYGFPSFSVNTDGQLIIVNPAFPLNICTAYVKYEQMFDYTIQNVPNEDF